jgi:hypothetical protein
MNIGGGGEKGWRDGVTTSESEWFVLFILLLQNKKPALFHVFGYY